jgi:hypothetical protein
MRCCLFGSLLGVALASVGAGADDPQPPAADAGQAALEQRVAELERQVTSLQQELQDIRREMQRAGRPRVAAMTPDEAVRSWQMNPDKLFTVEFGVESAGWPDAPIPIGEDQMPPIMADWDGRLSNGGKFTLLLTARAIRGLTDVGVDLPQSQPAELAEFERLGVLCKHLRSRGVRVTGFVRASRPQERYTDYYIVVDDPASFAINE